MQLGTGKIDKELLEKYDFYDYNHAIDILNGSFQNEWDEIKTSLLNFEISVQDIIQKGGNKSPIPKKFDEQLFPKMWEEVKITGVLQVEIQSRTKRRGSYKTKRHITLADYIDGHNVDFVKDGIAFDIEWNSKDQTFDRDLLAMRTYYDCGIISVGIILTRTEELKEVFNTLYFIKNGEKHCVNEKYDKSTTWMGKLLPRLDSRRNGGCPVLAIGIKKSCVTDWDKGHSNSV